MNDFLTRAEAIEAAGVDAVNQIDSMDIVPMEEDSEAVVVVETPYGDFALVAYDFTEQIKANFVEDPTFPTPHILYQFVQLD